MTKEDLKMIKHAKALKEYCESRKYCEGCIFENSNEECEIAKEEDIPSDWELPKAKPKLTKDELGILENVNKRFEWIARDKNGVLFVFGVKPIKSLTGWLSPTMINNLGPFEHLFSFIAWEDDEPYNITKLLKEA